ncbi:MAG: ATP-binding cassette domain-containing protein [Gammaproteobacteria bacterium]|nr:ATP-binding cassette domain-containing protein [Gammaproteobacteria bacterium]
MVEVQQLTKRFGARTAVDQLSFHVAPGEVLGFLGPNGAGKSTTMKMVTGFLQPTSGTARVNGFDILEQPLEAKKALGYLPEGAPAYGDMTVQQFLNFIADIRGLSGDFKRARMQRVIEDVHIGQVLTQRIDTLSKGFRRRVGLAQAIIHDPKVLILDEPTDGLDPNQKYEVRHLIRNMSKDKIIIVSTHILEEVEAVCTRAMIIAHGKLLADGKPEELAARSRYHGAITVKLDARDDAAQALKALPDVAEVQTEEAADELTVFPRNGAVLLPAVSALMAKKQWQVHALYQQKGRLDDVFRQITGGAAA